MKDRASWIRPRPPLRGTQICPFDAARQRRLALLHKASSPCLEGGEYAISRTHCGMSGSAMRPRPSAHGNFGGLCRWHTTHFGSGARAKAEGLIPGVRELPRDGGGAGGGVYTGGGHKREGTVGP